MAKTTNENVEIKEADAPDAVEEHAFVNVANLSEEAKEQTETPELMSVAFASPAAAQANATAFASPLNVVLDIIGTIVFGLYSLVIQAVGGPPVLPPGSTVTVRSSSLRIDCGCAPGEGEEVPVDWYIPENPEPDRLIYLQHGFLAAGSVVQPHRGGAGRADQQHRRRTVDHVELPVLRPVLARRGADAPGDGRPIQRRQHSTGRQPERDRLRRRADAGTKWC